ncbi:helix-turn-helix domain-containing protein [Carnobacterium sp. ISL-102]|uniref:helix-turn-helix domain-containing protein n=1 Tax=Carnobacterium sp. ISL-102 TaxID=2819142 RepID=UPI001BE815A6|nr:helix-turn-helix domain-containing protein [Carnobacterium sp. ISL-102]MBT2731662.1 helix-turn-helix domain-containing protein [Carnobacterium sp. ISL-102]
MNNKAIGMRIKNIRLKLGMTTEKFAQAFQEQPPSKGTISKWENGHYLPNNERLKRIAELGETTVDFILYGSLDGYARNLLKELEKELNEDDSITDEVAASIISDIEGRLFPKYFPHDYKDRESLEKEFNDYKKSAIELWTNYERIDLEIASRISHQISSDINDNKKYFYDTTYKKDGEQGKKVSTRADEIVRRLEKLDRFQRAYIDGLRYLDDKKVVKELDKVDSYTDKINTTIIL